jgi:chromosome segregation ATPase
VDISKEIDELKSKLAEYQQTFKDVETAINHLKSSNRSEIASKEKELEDWRAKLEVCQQERNQIKQEIKTKVKDLEQSNLSNTEKQAKINKLLLEHSQELEDLDNLLYEERAQYRDIRNSLINRLCEPCVGCQEKDQQVKNL